jgi:hypothetical protein
MVGQNVQFEWMGGVFTGCIVDVDESGFTPVFRIETYDLELPPYIVREGWELFFLQTDIF